MLFTEGPLLADLGRSGQHSRLPIWKSRIRIRGCRRGNVTEYHDRQEPTQGGHISLCVPRFKISGNSNIAIIDIPAIPAITAGPTQA